MQIRLNSIQKILIKCNASLTYGDQIMVSEKQKRKKLNEQKSFCEREEMYKNLENLQTYKYLFILRFSFTRTSNYTTYYYLLFRNLKFTHWFILIFILFHNIRKCPTIYA